MTAKREKPVCAMCGKTFTLVQGRTIYGEAVTKKCGTEKCEFNGFRVINNQGVYVSDNKGSNDV